MPDFVMKKICQKTVVIPDLIRPSQPRALLRRSRLGNPSSGKNFWIPAFAGMTDVDGSVWRGIMTSFTESAISAERSGLR